jgi:dTDP-4-amino-4,6-dideoxygalactose transaminase
MKVKFTNLYKLIEDKKKIFSKIKELVEESKFVGGDEVISFEKNFSKFTGAKYTLSLGNGTDALEIAIRSLNIKKNSEVILPVNTWISTAEAIVSNNLKIVFCDVNLNDYSICLDDLKKKINKNTKLIIPVHLYGNPTNIPQIKKIIGKKNIKIVEDCAQAHGASINGKHVGTFGDIGTFSFFPGKNLGSFGDGGALITNSKKIYEFSLRLKNHGAKKKYDHKFSGRNSRLDTIHAGVLNIKLKKYSKVIKKRNLLSKLYFQNLSKIKDIKLYNLSPNHVSSFHQFVIRVNTRVRDKLINYLKLNKIDTMIHYPYMLNELKFFPNSKSLKKSKNLGKKIISLPISEEHSKKEIYFVIKKIKDFFKNK